MSKIEIALSSPATWTIVGIFVYNGLTAVAPQLGGNVGDVANVALLLLAGYLHTSAVQKASA